MPAGRPSKYRPEFVDQAYKLCLLGATDDIIADFIGIARSKMFNWKKRYPEFGDAIARGKMLADAEIAHALYHRAKGYSWTNERMYFPRDGSEPREVSWTEQVPPDTNAASLWLRNRQPALWRDRIEHSGPGGEALQIQIVRYADPQPKVIEHESQAVDSSALVAPAAPVKEEAPIYIDSSTDPTGAREAPQVVEIRRFAGERKSQR